MYVNSMLFHSKMELTSCTCHLNNILDLDNLQLWLQSALSVYYPHWIHNCKISWRKTNLCKQICKFMFGVYWSDDQVGNHEDHEGKINKNVYTIQEFMSTYAIRVLQKLTGKALIRIFPSFFGSPLFIILTFSFFHFSTKVSSCH